MSLKFALGRISLNEFAASSVKTDLSALEEEKAWLVRVKDGGHLSSNALLS